MLVVALAMCASIALPSAASAVTQSVGGGVWDYGVQSGKAHSYYHHATKYHSATICNGKAGGVGVLCTKSVAEAGAWARATRNAAIGTADSAYWSTY